MNRLRERRFGSGEMDALRLPLTGFVVVDRSGSVRPAGARTWSKAASRGGAPSGMAVVNVSSGAVEGDPRLRVLFGAHLARARAARDLPGCLIGAGPSDGDSIPIPHFVWCDDGDHVVVEQMPRSLFHRWVGGVTTDEIAAWTRALPALLDLRALLRRRSADEESGGAIEALRNDLREGYLSFRFVLESPAVVRDALTDMEQLHSASRQTPEWPSLNDRYVKHERTLRGWLRHEVTFRQLRQWLPDDPAAVIDVGGGDGEQAVRVAALGHKVTVLDPDRRMVDATLTAATCAGLSDRITAQVGEAGDVGHTLSGQFDVALCHGVAMYLESAAQCVQAVMAALRPGGIASLVTKNADALAMRPALRGEYTDAVAAFSTDRTRGSLGVTTRGDTVAGLGKLFEAHGAEVLGWYGVRVLSDHLVGTPVPADASDLLAAELEAGQRDPYRSVAPLIHVVAVKRR